LAACSARSGRSPSCWASPATWRRSARTPGCSTTRTRWRRWSARSRRRPTSGSPGSATPSSGQSTGWPGYLGLDRDEVDFESAGLNHLAFVLRLEHRGRDLYPGLRAFVEAGKVPDDDLVRADLYRRLGYYPTESSEHHAEYNPWYIGKRDAAGDAVERFHVPIGEYLDRVAHNLDEYAETKRKLDAGEPFEIERSGEYAATIAESVTTGEPARIVVNAINRGALIPNLEADACVEVPALVDGLGVHPVAMGPLPLHLAAYVRGAVDMQGLTVRAALEEDRDAVGHAVMTDPIVQSHLTLDEAWRLTDAMIEAEAEWLPAWLGGSAAG
jgi:alpha-galactosidase